MAERERRFRDSPPRLVFNQAHSPLAHFARA